MAIIASDINVTSGDGYDMTGFNLHVTVKQGVYINGPQGDDAINMGAGGFDWLQNDGSLNAGEGVYAGGSQDYVWNTASGEMFGYYGVVFGAAEGSLINDGQIVASNIGVFLNASGSSVLINRGMIDSTDQGVGIYGSNSVEIENYGTIGGGTTSIYDSGGSDLYVFNSGTLDGDVDLTSTATDLINHGLINGNVTFGAGANNFHGAAGEVTGTITGGAGDDTIHLGADGETVDGGAGINKIYGGQGDDTFVFSALGTGDVNKLFNFNVSADTIELESSVFTKLVADATPNFKVATASTGPNNHLFYNSATGGIYYDADANGPGAAVMIGSVGAGLNLTANNFTVV